MSYVDLQKIKHDYLIFLHLERNEKYIVTAMELPITNGIKILMSPVLSDSTPNAIITAPNI